ncbi:MAG: glycosyltransferase [Betaproteobacteria bacterium HGW-Betaproteobacteria-7]|jgi:glycosyltransferase involved in cell wall biosynthesis|nr:MAG: glycosyltransferase [Betaproteobacteria bacterium HGW-Betaproteobacteria-7]
MNERWVLQFCHCHYGPFLDVARQYAALFAGGPCKVMTVFLTGEDTPEARQGAASDEVLFMNFRSADIRGLKLKAIRQLRAILTSRPFELIIAHRFKPLYIACLASGRLPVIGVHHAFGDYSRAPRRWLANAFRQRLLLLGVSNAVRDDIRRQLPDWPEARIQTLYNRIDVDAVRGQLLPRAAAREALQLPPDAWIVGNVGRLHPDKDQATLIRGFALARDRLPADACLAIMGSGELADDLQRLASELGVADQVRFLGQVPGARRYFRAFDVFALSSDHEPFGMVLLEAMAADLPIICSDCGGGKEVVADPEARFPLGDASCLAERLVALARAPHDPAPAERLHALFSDEAARQSWAHIVAAAALPAASPA